MADPGERQHLSSKDGKFRQTHDGKFECLLCSRKLASKQNILSHLHSLHGFTPVRRKQKRYVDDDSFPVPRSTVHRWKKSKLTTTTECCAKKSLIFENVLSPRASEDHQPVMEDISEAGPSSSFSSSCGVFNVPSGSKDSDAVSETLSTNEDHDVAIDLSFTTDTEPSDLLDSGSEADVDNSSISDNSSIDSDCSSYSSNCSEETSPVSDIEEPLIDLTANNSLLSDQESQALTILSCFLRNSLSTSACKDILETMKCLFPDSQTLEMLDFGQILAYVDSAPIKEIHYCVLCSQVFPNDVDLFRCSKENCTGLRYKGPLSMQMKKGRQPRQCFVFADVKHQLKSLLQSPGIWNDIQKYKASISCRNTDVITDLSDGSCYHRLYNDGGFMAINHGQNLTAVFNTDGVNLYSSSKIELWPIFLAINELSPVLRFARENMLLVGIWQGKGKPPFIQYMECFTNEMNALYDEGIDLQTDQRVVNIRLAVTCGIADLPAKAGLLNMTMYNGCDACISCEEPGVQVKQGKGTSKCFPYRDEEDRYQLRTSDNVLTCMQSGTDKKWCKGFKGACGLNALHSFDLVQGMVPDYMHGILLGIAKTLLNKWFAPSSSGTDYFLGKHIKEISQRMQAIKPPVTIERLPRNLEKHYNNLKATELQAWLLYYALPCLNGFLKDPYMQNLACLSEGVYILLGDSIRQQDLDRAETLLDKFYSSFIELYGKGSCGLNVHNAGVHLVQYVRMWGPLWSWSCFPFEDANAMLLQAVHGTGVVLKQVMRYRQAQSCIRQKGIIPSSKTSWKVTLEADNCCCAGGLKKFSTSDIEEDIIKELGVENLDDVGKIDRVLINGKRFYAKSYSRMQKRVCSIVMYEENCLKKIGSIIHFVYMKRTNIVHAIVAPFQCGEDGEDVYAKHLIPVKKTPMPHKLVTLDALIDTLVFINPRNSQDHLTKGFVAKMPNRHGHSVFK